MASRQDGANADRPQIAPIGGTEAGRAASHDVPANPATEGLQPSTSTKQSELQDFRRTLSPELQKELDRMIEDEGVDKVHSQLGWLKKQAEYLESL